MRSKAILSVLAVACVFALTHSTQADDEIDSKEVACLQQTGEILPQEQILERASSRQPGEVTEIELKKKDGRYAYEVDVVDDQGVKRELTFDAKTGEFLVSEKDDEDGENDNADCDDDEPEERG